MHALKKEVAMNGSNRILSARLGQDIIVTSSPGERSVTYLGPCLRRIPRLAVYGYSHWLQGLDLSNGQHVSHNDALNNCHDGMTNHKEKYSNINTVYQLLEIYNFYYNKSHAYF